MSNDPIIWLGAIALATIASVCVVALGCYLLRRPVEDVSNSSTWSAYILRLWRIIPGLVISIFGCVILLEIVQRILAMSLSGP